MTTFEILATDLLYPEGPVSLSDGSILVSEVGGGCITMITEAGKQTVASPGLSPAGCAIGPDGLLYVCNSGGTVFRNRDGLMEPFGTAEDYAGGRIDRVDLQTGVVQVLYRECEGRRFSSPNDIVFDAQGGFYFTDLGKTHARSRDRGAVFYALPDGSAIRQAVYPLETPNGIGLSPEGDRLYVAETIPGRLWAFDVLAPGVLRTRDDRFARGDLVAGLAGLNCFDSLAVQANGSICIATLVNGGITRISPDGQTIEHFGFPDGFTTNICFGGVDMRRAYVTLSSTKRLVVCDWDQPGLRLNFC